MWHRVPERPIDSQVQSKTFPDNAQTGPVGAFLGNHRGFAAAVIRINQPGGAPQRDESSLFPGASDSLLDSA
jgi:hypothetical protein